MADTSFNAGGTTLTITKGSAGLYAYSNNFPGVGIPSGTPGNFASGPLTFSNLSSAIENQNNFINSERGSIATAQQQLVQLQLNPASVLGSNYTQSSYDWAFKEQQDIIRGAETRIAGAENAKSALSSLRDNISSIEQQYTQSNPATEGASSPAAVPPPDSVEVQNQQPGNTSNGNTNAPVDPGEDPFEQSRQDAEKKANQAGPTSQDVIDAEEDPIEKARLEAAQKTTNQAPSAQDVIDAEEDPFERERMAAAQRSTNEVVQPQVQVDPNEDPFEASRLEAEQKLNRQELADQEGTAGPKGGTTAKTNTTTSATNQDQRNYAAFEDWRVRLHLAQNIKALYKVDGDPGILKPLVATNGIVFPYTPSISVQYAAHYDAPDVVHTNYKVYSYKNSSVDSISVSCDFTAQDTFEANYLLAVIHFLRTVTKMFYGQDQNPKRGTPPPLCFLTGLGSYQFDNHPLAITGFTYNLPTDVDYIRAGTETTLAGVNKGPQNVPDNSLNNTSGRMTGIAPGGVKPPPKFKGTPGGTIEPTYVPTKMQISISAIPIITRNDISNNFSVKDYATGELLRGNKGNKRISGGIW